MSADILQSQDRKANKQHICCYCGCAIEKGEVYEWEKIKHEGTIYEWKSHKKCGYIARQLWYYADLYNGMSDDDFTNACRNFCQTFICPDCPRRGRAYDETECQDAMKFCINKIYDFLQTHELYRERMDGWREIWKWKCRERKEKGIS